MVLFYLPIVDKIILSDCPEQHRSPFSNPDSADRTRSQYPSNKCSRSVLHPKETFAHMSITNTCCTVYYTNVTRLLWHLNIDAFFGRKSCQTSHESLTQ